MQLSVAREDYIRAILRFDDDGGTPVTVSALASRMGVTPPSVTGMVQRLVSDGLVEHTPRAGVRLTPHGRDLALSVQRRHRLLETFLVQVLGLDWSEVHEEAERLEHHLSARVVLAMDRCLGHPKFDPHGHPIPGEDGDMLLRDLCPFESLAAGDVARVGEVHSDQPERIRWWKEQGLIPGARVEVVEHSPFDGVWHLLVEGRACVTGAPGIAGIRVERVR